MNTLVIPRPAPVEAAPFFHGYIAEVAGENIGDQLEQQLAEVENLFRNIDEPVGLFRYAPGKWSVKEILGHLADTERIFAYRLLRISRDDATPLPGFDENAYVPAGHFDDRSLSGLVREFRAVRAATIALVEGLPGTAWTRAGVASGKAISTRALAYILVGHVTHHLRVLRERYGLHTGTEATATA